MSGYFSEKRGFNIQSMNNSKESINSSKEIIVNAS